MLIRRTLIGLSILALAVVAGLFALPRVTGHAVFVVEGGSMEPTIAIGSLIVVDRSDREAKAGTVATFADPDVGLVTHRIVGLEGDLIITKGDANERPDSIRQPRSRLVGSVRASVPLAGYLVRILQIPLVFFGLLTTTGAWLILGELRTISNEVSRIRSARKAVEPPSTDSV
jgi:signal peptidase